jgi:hypothetical protein
MQSSVRLGATFVQSIPTGVVDAEFARRTDPSPRVCFDHDTEAVFV